MGKRINFWLGEFSHEVTSIKMQKASEVSQSFYMYRKEDIVCYKEIISISDIIGASSFNLASTKEHNSKSNYKLHV